MKSRRPLKPFKGAEWDGKRWIGISPKKKPYQRPIRRRKIRKLKDDLIYSQRRRWFLSQEENSFCPVAQAGLIRDINGQHKPHHRASTSLHHAWLRGRYYLEESTWFACSDEGHRWIEDHKNEARHRGWLCDTAETKEKWRDKRNGFPVQ